MTKLNLGCGPDRREGWINLDGNPKVGPDICMNLEKESLLDYFRESMVDHVMAFDVLEHLPHYVAVETLRHIFTILKPGGTLELRVPDASAIINAPIPINEKLKLLFGGQDIPVDKDPVKNKLRSDHPEFFCHKYGWTHPAMRSELERIGFFVSTSVTHWPNFIMEAEKP